MMKAWTQSIGATIHKCTNTGFVVNCWWHSLLQLVLSPCLCIALSVLLFCSVHIYLNWLFLFAPQMRLCPPVSTAMQMPSFNRFKWRFVKSCRWMPCYLLKLSTLLKARFQFSFFELLMHLPVADVIMVPLVFQNQNQPHETTVHVDGFLYDDDLVDQLCDEGQMSRNYCTQCGSHRVAPLSMSILFLCMFLWSILIIYSCMLKNQFYCLCLLQSLFSSLSLSSCTTDFISHSMTLKQLRFVMQHLLPSLQGKILLDVGSRTGAVLYGVCHEFHGIHWYDSSYCLMVYCIPLPPGSSLLWCISNCWCGIECRLLQLTAKSVGKVQYDWQSKCEILVLKLLVTISS